jgi:hypothetical protein
MPERGDEISRFQDRKVLGHGLPCHGKAVAEFVQGLAVPDVKPVQQRPPRRIGERSEDVIHDPTIGNQMVACQVKMFAPFKI